MLEKTKTNAKQMGLILMAVLLAAGCWWGYGRQQQSEIPQLTTFVDSTGTIDVEEEEVPLAKPKVTTKKSTETKKKTVKLKKKSKKTYTKKKPAKTKTTTKTTTKGDTTTKIEKQVVTKVTEKYKKNSKKKTVTTKTTTTIKTTVTTNAEQGNSTVSSQNKTQNDGVHYVDNSEDTSVTTEAADSPTKSQSNKKAPYDVAIEQSAPQADDMVLKAFNTLGFTVTINSSVSYAGYFNARNQSIILRDDDDTIYHELGHFLAFIAGNVDTKDAFKAVYEAEKGEYNGANKAYVTQNSSEYFAESYRDYVLNPSELQASRPETYASIQNALKKITVGWIQTIKTVYSPVWK